MVNISTDVLQAVVRELEAHGIDFSYARYMEISGDDIPEFMADPDSVIARIYGVSKDDYIEWENSETPPRCCGITRRGRRCKHYVNGSGWAKPDIAAYLRLRGGYCVFHGG